MTTELPSPAELLATAIEATERAKHSGTLNTPGWFEYARIRLDIAREIREGSLPPKVIITDDVEMTVQAVEAARAAFGSRVPAVHNVATTYGDVMAAAETAVIHLEQPMPVPNDRVSIQALVREDLEERERVGVKRYGTPLQAFNGRSAMRDAYEEALDLCCYLRQKIAEDEAA